MNVKDAKSIPLDEFLENLGHACAKMSGGRKWYRAPYREENTPSFVLTKDRFAWYDHGEGRGGSIIELAMRCGDLRDVSDALSYIERTVGKGYAIPTIRMENKPMDPELPFYELITANNFRTYVGRGMSKGAQYLVSRCINPDAVTPYIKDVKFNAINNVKRAYTGIGIRNNEGGFEVRFDRGRGYEKTTVGAKAVSFFPTTVKGSENGTLHIFEGAPDFYTYLTWNSKKPNSINPASQSYLILNGTGMTTQAIKLLQDHHFAFVAIWSQYGKGGHQMEDELLTYLSMINCKAGTTKDMYAPPSDTPEDQLSKWDFNAWYVAQNMILNTDLLPQNKAGLRVTPKLYK